MVREEWAGTPAASTAKKTTAEAPYLPSCKGQPDQDGHMRLMCPAAGAAPIVRCELKPLSIERTTSATTRTSVTPELLEHPARICQQDSVTFPPEAGAKFLQKLHYGSPEWSAMYNTLRNTVEGFNGIAKDGAYASLGDATRRRIRGIAAQTLFAALLVFATNVRSIRSFLWHSVSGTNGGARRRRRRKARRTTRSIKEWRPTVDPRSGAPPP